MPPSTSQEALKQLYGLQRSRKKPTDILNESEGRLGLPTARERQAGLRGAIMNTENMIRNVEPSVTGRTSGSLTTEAQRQAIVGQETRPLAEQFREQSRALEGETANLDALSSRALAETQLGIGEQDAKERFLGSIYDKLLGTEAENQRRSEAQRAYDLQVRQLEEQIRQQKAASSQYSGLQAALQGLLSTPPKATSQTQVKNPDPVNLGQAARVGGINFAGNGPNYQPLNWNQAINSGGLGTPGQRGFLQAVGSWLNPFR